MKVVYFDTSVYNKILEDPKYSLITKALERASACGKFEVLFSINNFEEFCHTPDVDRGTQLFKLAYSICRHRFILRHVELIKRELEAYLKGSVLIKENIYDKTDFEDIFSKAINGTLFQGVPNRLFKQMKKGKRDFLKFEKNSKKKLAPLWKAHRNIAFDEFYQNSSRNKEGRAWLEDICIRALEDNIRDKQDFSDLNLLRLPGLRCLFKYECASIYRQLLKGKKPGWGSGIDMNHSVFLGYCDIFVTADNNFLDIVRLFKEPKVKCFSFNEFMVQYLDAKI